MTASFSTLNIIAISLYHEKLGEAPVVLMMGLFKRKLDAYFSKPPLMLLSSLARLNMLVLACFAMLVVMKIKRQVASSQLILQNGESFTSSLK